MSKKEYNPNTKYGRKKLREQARQEYEEMSPKEKEEHNTAVFFLTLIFIIIFGGIAYMAGGLEGLLKWLT